MSATLELVNPLYTSSPVGVFQAAVDYIPSTEFREDLTVSGIELVVGLLLSIAFGVLFGLLMGWYRWLYYLSDPLISFMYSLPRIAFIPLMIIIFGIGVNSKIALIFVMTIFPLIINTVAGVRSVDRELLDMSRSFCAKERALFRTIILPSAAPSILAGIRVSIGLGLIAVAVGELFASAAGVGHFIAVAGATFRTDDMFLGTFILGFFGIVFSSLVRAVEKRVGKWRPHLKS